MGGLIKIEKILNSCNEKNAFVIEGYQRGYRWSKEQIDKLFEDVINNYKKI